MKVQPSNEIACLIPDIVKDTIEKFKNNNFSIYPVGGAVRDMLMGKIIYDWDFTTNATPKQMLKLLKDNDAYYTNEFGTVGIPDKKGERPLEITTFRTEQGYLDARHPDKVKWGKSLKEDLQRRDFTINAIALEITKVKTKNITAKIIDPFQGQADIKRKLIRAVGQPKERFSEDALRMMRGVRIASEIGFLIEENTLKAIQKNAVLINKIAKERVKDELFKILISPYPDQGMLLLKNTGLLEQILPEFAKTFGVEQKSPGRHHIYDVGTHSVNALKFCKSQDPVTRLATLIHDIGKPQTYKKLNSGVITFYNHEIVSTRIAERIANRLKLSNQEKKKLLILVRWHQFSVDERQTDSAVRRFINNVGKENIPDMLSLRVADRLGGGARETSWRLEEFKKRLLEVQKQPFTVYDLKVDGHDVMKIKNLAPGPKVGEILNHLFEEVAKKKIANKREDLLKRIEEIN